MKILIVFAHPRLSNSVVQRRLLEGVRGISSINVHDLYFSYPDFNIDVEAEKTRLIEHDIVVLQHPFYWYSFPALLKEWLDLVLEFKWAYGPGGDALRGKFLMTALSTGGDEDAYRSEGRNRFSVDILLSPLNQTAHLCGMGWLRPFVIYSGRRLRPLELTEKVEEYRNILLGLSDGSIEPLQWLAEGYSMPVDRQSS